MQHRFRKFELLQLLILGAAVVTFGRWVPREPDRVELGPRPARIYYEPITLDPGGFGSLRLTGAWEVRSNDPRFGGVSALALDHGALVALTDSGGVVRFSKPSRRKVAAFIREVPAGPGSPRYKSRRDSEALLRDSAGRGWWIAFEKRNELWLFDHRFARSLKRVELGANRWPRNVGIEALGSERDALLLMPEGGDTVVEIRGRQARTRPIENPAGRISDAVSLSSGGLLVLNRRLTPLGFANSIAALERTPTGFRYGRRIRLVLAPLDNAEALAAEQLADGGTRLWIMTDDNFRRPFRTLLVALDMPGAPKRD